VNGSDVQRYPILMSDARVMVLADGRDLGWLEYGDHDGFPILAFHGTPGSRTQLVFDEVAVRDAGVRMICVDRPGYGFSSFMSHRRLTDWPGDVTQLVDRLDIERFAVMGVSGGGPHAAACASALGDRVTAAAIVSGVGPLANSESTEGMSRFLQVIAKLAARRSRLLHVALFLQLSAVRRWPDKTFEMMLKQNPPSDIEILKRPEIRSMLETGATRASRTAWRAAAQDMELFASEWGFDLGSISVPVHLWQGDADRTVPPSHATLMHRLIPGSQLHECPGEGHFLVVDRIVEIATLLKSSSNSGPVSGS
jgi:pimeloyl-ACP methyl ester carboxylesterase